MIFKFCPECAAPLEKKTDTHYICKNGHDAWNNPHPAAAVLLIKDGKVLVAERGVEPNKGKFDLPGGHIEFGEDLFDAAKREVLEETGLVIDDIEVMGIYMQVYTPTISACDIVVLAKKWDGTINANDDVASLEWQPLEFIDDPSFAPRYPGLVDKLQAMG